MKVKYLVGGLMLAATLFSVGCGVDEEMSSPMESVEESEATVWCTNKSWLINFYAEPEMINIVGWMRCQCYQPQTRGGDTTGNNIRLAFERTCSLD